MNNEELRNIFLAENELVGTRVLRNGVSQHNHGEAVDIIRRKAAYHQP